MQAIAANRRGFKVNALKYVAEIFLRILAMVLVFGLLSFFGVTVVVLLIRYGNWLATL